MARIREITASSQQEIIIERATVISIQCRTELYQSNASENSSGGTVTSLNGPNPRLQLVSRTQSKLADLGCFGFDSRIRSPALL